MFVKLIIPFLLFLTGCAPVSQSIYWGQWSDWTEWKNTEKIETRRLAITSLPSNSSIYIDDKFKGTTPLRVNLSYAVLESKKERKKYKATETNYTPNWILFGKGDRPGSRQIIDSEKDIRVSLKNTYRLVVKNKGYIPGYKIISHDDTKANFILKKQFCLFFKDMKIIDETKLSATQKIYDALYKKKYSKDIKPEELKKIFKAKETFRELFIFSKDNEGCSSLNCQLVIRDDYTNMNISILDAKGGSILTRSSSFKTGPERAHFLSALKNHISKETENIHKTLNKD